MAGGLGSGMEWAYECVENKKPHRQLCGLVGVRVEKLSSMKKIMHKFDDAPARVGIAYTNCTAQTTRPASRRPCGIAECFRQVA